MNCWKQNDHILGVLLSPVAGRPKRSFLEKFYEGELLLFFVCLESEKNSNLRSAYRQR